MTIKYQKDIDRFVTNDTCINFSSQYLKDINSSIKEFLNENDKVKSIISSWITNLTEPKNKSVDDVLEAEEDLSKNILNTLNVLSLKICNLYKGKNFNSFILAVKNDFNFINTFEPEKRTKVLNEIRINCPNLFQYLKITQKESDFTNDIQLPSDFDVKVFCHKVLFEYCFFSLALSYPILKFGQEELNIPDISEFLKEFLNSSSFLFIQKLFNFEYPFPTEESFSDRLPKNVKKLYNKTVYNSIALEFLKIKNKVEESDYIDFYEDNFFALLTNNSSYFNSTVSTSRYLDAVRFYTLISGGASYTSAFCTIFKDRVKYTRQEIIDSNPYASEAEIQKIFNDRISSKASAYAKGKLVSEVLSRDILPNSLRYYDARHKALNTLIDICSDESNTPKNRIEASNYILTHTNNLVKQDNQADFTEESRTTFLQSFINDLNKIGRIQKFLIDNNEITVEDASKQSIYTKDDTEVD